MSPDYIEIQIKSTRLSIKETLRCVLFSILHYFIQNAVRVKKKHDFIVIVQRIVDLLIYLFDNNTNISNNSQKIQNFYNFNIGRKVLRKIKFFIFTNVATSHKIFCAQLCC